MIALFMLVAISATAQRFKVPELYQKSVRPSIAMANGQDAPADEIHTSIYVEDIFSVATQGTFNLFMILTQSWKDERLDLNNQYPGYEYAEVDESQIWVPTANLNKLIDTELVESWTIIA
jgi:hypothetical protein